MRNDWCGRCWISMTIMSWSRHKSYLGTAIMSSRSQAYAITVGNWFASGALSWLIGIGRIVLKPGIFRVRYRCCGSLDLEKAGSWYNNMSVSRRYSCCIMVITSGLRFTFSWTIWMGSVSIFLTIGFEFFFTFLVDHIVVLWSRGLGFPFALLL